MLNISIVLYKPNWEEVNPLVEELKKVKSLQHLYLHDNTNDNIGYGRAHNVEIRKSVADKVPYHLVMNSDIRVKAEDIDAMCAYMEAHPEVGQLMPKVVSPDGSQQYLAKRLPTPLDVFGRRFLPAAWMAKRNKRYELRDLDLTQPVNAPYLSGCFMLFRTAAVEEADPLPSSMDHRTCACARFL